MNIKDHLELCVIHPMERLGSILIEHNCHDDGGETMKPLSIFNQPGKGSKKRTRRNLSAIELQSASTHVLLNCPQVKPFVE